MEDHVRGDALLLGGGPAPGTQLLEQRRGLRGHVVRDRCGLRRPGGPGPGRPLGLAAQHHLAPPAEHVVTAPGQLQGAVVALDGEQALGQQLAHDAAPLRLGQLRADAEHGQRVVPVLGHLGGAAAEQDVDHLAGPEPLAPLMPEPVHRGQELLGGDGPIPRLGRGLAGVAVAARPGVLAEVAEQLGPAAFDRLAQGQHRVQMGSLAAAVGQVPGRGLDQLALLDHVLQAVGQPRAGRQPVPPGPAGLLVVPLDRAGQVQVGHEAHVGLVDAHPERDRGHHDQAVLPQEAGLVPGPGEGVQPCVVGQRGDPVGGQELSRLLHRGPRQAVDDASLTRVFVADEVQQLTARLSLGHYPVVDVGAVEARHEMTRACQAEPVRDLGAGGLGGGSGQRDAGHLRPALVQPGQGQVVGAEVVPPLGHAVRLVDGEQRDRAPVEQRHGGLGAQPLRGQVEQVQVAGQERGLHLAPLGRFLGGIQEAGPDAERPHGVHLVLHQRDQRGDDHPGSAADQRGNLVAE